MSVPASSKRRLPLDGYSILLVDDEPKILASMRRLLMRRGARVHMAESAGEAIEVYQGGSFHVVVSDINMPSRSGVALARELRCIEPQLPVVLYSGRLRGLARKELDQLPDCPLLYKPVDSTELVDCIRSVAKLS